MCSSGVVGGSDEGVGVKYRPNFGLFRKQHKRGKRNKGNVMAVVPLQVHESNANGRSVLQVYVAISSLSSMVDRMISLLS